MKFLNALFSLVLFATSACTDSKPPHSVGKPIQKKTINVKSNASVAFQVSGMVCKMGCGGAIRKGLRSTGRVANVAIDFKTGAKDQKIEVFYDSTLISIAEMKEVVEKTNDGQFRVITSCPKDEGPHQ